MRHLANILIIVAALALMLAVVVIMAGCTAPIEAKALSPELKLAISAHVEAEMNMHFEQNKNLSATSSGDQKGGDDSTNFGPIAIEGGAFLALCVVVMSLGRAWLKNRKALDWRIRQDMNKPDDWKQTQKTRAKIGKVGKQIRNSVRRIKRQRE